MDSGESGNSHPNGPGPGPPVSRGNVPHIPQSRQPSAGSFVVQPILISSPLQSSPGGPAARAPPSLIPIATFSNQQKMHHGFESGRNLPLHTPDSLSNPRQQINVKTYQEADDVDEDDEEIEDESWPDTSSKSNAQRFGHRQSTTTRMNHLPASTSPLVSTSSHSIVSGVKLHIHRAPMTQTISAKASERSEVIDTVYSEDSEEDVAEPPQSSSQQHSFSSPKTSNLRTILNAIRSNTSLTIEEVSPSPSTSSGSIGFGTREYPKPKANEIRESAGNRSEDLTRGHDKVEVFIVPQTSNVLVKDVKLQSSGQTVKTEIRPKRGRPRRLQVLSPSPSTPTPLSQQREAEARLASEPTDTNSASRRTQRDRKPTKHFMPDTSRFRGFRKRGIVEAESSSEGPGSPHLPVTPVPVEKVTVEESSETVSTPKRRGRPSTGRSRGRPRGSTMKAKLERGNAATLLALGDEAASITPHDARTPAIVKTPTLKSETPGDGGPHRKTAKTPRGTRAARGGARGGRRITKAQKIQKAKLKKLLSNRKDSLQLFEEETRMSSDVKAAIAISQIAEGEDASSSTNTSTTTKQKKQSKATEIEESRPVTADTLFEYHWPVDDPLAEIFFLQEQVSEYLGVKSFKRKYPDLKRRIVEMAERDFLRGHKIVSEFQCDLGLTALYSNDVLEIMFNDFPDKYEEYRIVVQERRDREFVKQKSQQSSTPAVRDKGAEFMRRILNSTSSWNSKLNRERSEDRSCSFDLQSFTLNIQKSKMKVLPPHATKVGYYPVSVLPGQFTDNFKRYSTDELKYLPLNTVSFGPLIENQVASVGSDDSSDSDGSSNSDNSSSSSDSDEKDDSGSSGIGEKRSSQLGSSQVTSVVGEQGSSGDSVTCRTCEGGVNKNKDGTFEVLIQCTKCSVANHPSCLELSLDMLPFIRKYNWQCTDCKNCIECNDPADEDKMLFCDLCDRGYHIYCVGLRRVPTGRWHCRVCSVCYSCGSSKPAGDERSSEWHHEFTKGEKGTRLYIHSICITCHKLFKKGQFCPACNKSHQKIDDKLLIECRTCEKWVHRDCVKRPLQTMFGFMCDPCDVAFRAKAKIPANM